MQRTYSSSVRIFYPKFNKEKIIQMIREKLGELEKRLPILLVVLFGSYAKGSYHITSDIDILVVYEGKKIEEAYVLVKRTLDIPHLEPHVYTEWEYKKIKNTIGKMTRDGIILYQNLISTRAEPPQK